MINTYSQLIFIFILEMREIIIDETDNAAWKDRKNSLNFI